MSTSSAERPLRRPGANGCAVHVQIFGNSAANGSSEPTTDNPNDVNALHCRQMFSEDLRTSLRMR